MADLAEDVIFALIRYKGGEVLSNHAMPVGGVVLVEERLDVLGNGLLLLGVVHDFIYLGDKVFLLIFADLLDHPSNVSICGSHFVFKRVCLCDTLIIL